MIELGLAIAIGSLFVLPALAVGGRQLMAQRRAQREAARARLELAREREEAAAQAERDRIDTLWREHPDIGGLTEYLRFIHLRRGQLDGSGSRRTTISSSARETSMPSPRIAAASGCRPVTVCWCWWPSSCSSWSSASGSRWIT